MGSLCHFISDRKQAWDYGYDFISYLTGFQGYEYVNVLQSAICPGSFLYVTGLHGIHV
jgi:heme/copper-type cytochrome/quinol oxidase subunit 3